MKTNGVMIALVLSVNIILPAQGTEQCSIHPPKGATDAQLASLAKISESAARETALREIRSTAEKSVRSAELEAEHGCLIWSFDVKLSGESGVREVQVDAGTGKVISIRHESARQEAVEASKEGPHSKTADQATPK